MTDLLNEVEYGRVLGSFTAVAEDFGETVAPDAIPLNGKITFNPTKSNVSYINSAGETANLYVAPVQATISNGRIIGKDGRDGVVLLASNSNNVSASVLWNARISLNPVVNGNEAPADQDFLIEVRRGEVVSLIDVIKATSLVHNIALFNDAIATAAEKFWERVEAGEFRGNQGPPGPAGGPGIGMPGPVGIPGRSGVDGAPGVGGNLIADGDLESPGFLVAGDYTESNDALNGAKSASITEATSRKILLEPEKSYIGSVYIKSPTATSVSVDLRVFGPEGDISRVITNAYNIPADTWRKVTFLLDSEVGDQSVEIITRTDGRRVLVDNYFLSDNSVVAGLQKDLSAAQAQLEAAMADLDVDLENVDAERERLAQSLNDLAVVLEDANVDLSAVEAEIADLNEDLATEAQKRFDADQAAQILMQQLDQNLSQAKQDLAANQVILDNLSGELDTAAEELQTVNDSLNTLETVTLPALEQNLSDAAQAAQENLNELENQLLGSEGEVTKAKESINQLVDDLAAEAQARQDLATTMQTTFQERDVRLATAEDILAQAFPTGVVDVSRTLRSSIVEYAVSSSETVPPTSGWTTDTPTRAPGKFIWFRTVVTYMDDTTSTTSAALLTGNTGATGPEGPAGADGADGTGVTILGSKTSESQLPTTGNPGDAYLVEGYLYVWTDGTWTNVGLIRGPQGVQGPAGVDGKPTYTWVKYSDSATGAGMSDDPAGMSYIGLSHNNVSDVESTDPADYQWAKFQGPKGDTGSQGIQGPKGADGTSLYTWLKYADTPTTGMSDSPDGKKYIGLAYNKTTPTESNIYGDYQWTLVQGEQGVPGADGADGTPRYTWIKYATSSTGAGMSDSPTGKTYIGLAYNKTTATESSNAADYEWALIQGPKGDTGSQGIQGPKGADGSSLFTWIKYADTPTTGMSDLPTGKKYMGIAYNKTSSTESSVYGDYEWSLIEGPQGIQGPVGANGQTTYTWIKYGTSASGAGISDSPTGKTYIGIAYNKTTAVESANASDYEWSLIQGPKGDTGTQGVSITSVTPYFRDAARGSAAPATPTTTTPSGWSTSEPAWAEGRDLYRTEKITYSNGTFAYTTVTKIASYAGIDAAMAAANGKNKITYTDLAVSSKPGPAPAPDSSRAIGDIHRNRDSTSGEIWAEYQWTGSAWKAVTFGDDILRSLDVGKITGGTGAFQQFFAQNLIADNATMNKLWTDQLVARTALFNQISISGGNILIDPNGLDPVLRTKMGGASWTWDDTNKYWKRSAVKGATTQYNTFVSETTSYDSNLIDAGAMYVIRYEVWVDDVRPDTLGRVAIYYRRDNGTTAFVADGLEAGGDTTSGTTLIPNQWNTVERFWRAPADAVSGGIAFQMIYTGNNATEVRIRKPFVGKQAPAVLIEDGAISAEKVNAQSVAAAIGQFVKVETSNLIATDSIKTPSAVIDKLWADGLVAKTGEFNRVTVAPGNVWPDPNFQDQDAWAGDGVRFVTNMDDPTKKDYCLYSRTVQSGSYYVSSTYRGLQFEPGATYRIRLLARFGGNSPIENDITVYLRTSLLAGGDTMVGAKVTRNVGYKYDWVETELTIPETSSGYSTIGLFTTGPYDKTGTTQIAYVEMTKKVGAVLIEDGAVNAPKINAQSVAGAVGEFVKLDVKNLVASSANIDSLVAQKIAAGTAAFQTVNADKIVASTGTMDSATINQIWADGIAAKSLVTSSITVASGNVIPNGSLAEGDAFWTASSVVDRVAITGVPGVPYALHAPPGTGSQTVYDGPLFPVTPGGKYVFEFWMRADKNGSTIYIELRDEGGAHASSSNMQISPNSTGESAYLIAQEDVPTAWTKYQVRVNINSDVSQVRIGTFYFNHSSGSVRDAEVWVAGMSLRPMTGAVLIEDGAVSANHIAADSIDTDHLRTNSVSAAKIVSGAVTTDKMTANSINGDRITANTLNASKITANSITASKIASRTISAAEIKSRTITANEIVAGTITSNEIKARTITAAEIRTATITANELNVSNITSDSGFITNFWANTITADKITSSHIDVDELWANVMDTKKIYAENLVVSTGGNLFVGSRGIPEMWNSDHITYYADGGKDDEWSITVKGSSSQVGGYGGLTDIPRYGTPVVPGGTYRISYWVKTPTSYSGSNGPMVFCRTYDSTGGNYAFASPSVVRADQTSANEFVRVSGHVTAPDTGTRLILGFYVNGGYSGETRFSGLAVQQVSDGVLIKDGTITADHINATSVGTELITAGTLRTSASGERLELNSQGVVLFGADSEDGERVRLGPAGDNLLTIGTSTISDSNVSAETGNYDALTVGGEDILEMFPPLPRGRVAQNWLTKTTDYSDSSLQKRFYVEFETEPGRQYVATVPPFYLQVLKPAGISVSYRMQVWNLDTGAIMEDDVQIHSTRNSIPDMNLHTVPGAVIDLPNFSVPTLFRFVVGTVSGSGEGVRVRAANNFKAGITIDDVGPIKDNSGSYWTWGNLGDGSGGNEPPPPAAPEPTRYTKTWSYAGYGGDVRSGEVIQGQYGSYGNRSGSWTFPTAMRSALSGAKIEKFEIYLYATHWYYNAGGTASIRPTNGSYQGWTGSAFTKSGWPRSAGKWVSVPSSWFPYIVSGTYKGIGVQTGSSSLQYYGRFKATSTKFRVTYRK